MKVFCFFCVCNFSHNLDKELTTYYFEYILFCSSGHSRPRNSPESCQDGVSHVAITLDLYLKLESHPTLCGKLPSPLVLTTFKMRLTTH